MKSFLKLAAVVAAMGIAAFGASAAVHAASDGDNATVVRPYSHATRNGLDVHLPLAA